MCKAIFLAFIVSIDIYLVSAALCNNGIFIPRTSAAVISLIGAFVLGVSAELSSFISRFLPASVCHRAGTVLLLVIGVLTIMKSVVRSLIGRASEGGELSIKMGKSIILKLYLDDAAADRDDSKRISAGEAMTLALASSADSAAIGLSSGTAEVRVWALFFSALLFGYSAVFLGNLTGRLVSSFKADLSWIGGVFIILFAVFIG